MTRASDANKHGLRRSSFTKEDKQRVRRRVGFGCVMCSKLPIQYHHFDPPFADATAHNPDGITLLCGYCHDMVSRGIYSDRKVRKWNANPKSLRVSPHQPLDISFPLNLLTGSVLFRGTTGPWLSIDGIPLISIGLSEDNEPLLTANFFDDNDQPAIVVVDNELQFRAPAWDITVTGGRITAWRESRHIVFDAVTRPPHSLYIRDIKLSHQGWTLVSDSNGATRISYHEKRVFDANANHILIFGGHLALSANGGFTATGGTAFGPYPSERLRELAALGQIEQIFLEFCQPVLYVTPARTERNVTSTVEPTVDANGQRIYPLLCEVCNQVQCGTSDAPKARSGLMCESCANLPFDSWKVMFGTGQEVARFLEKRDAVDAAFKVLETIRATGQDIGLRLVIHGLPGERQKFVFADKTY